MSAIWGFLSFTNKIKDGLSETMEAPYKERCKIDRYSRQQNAYLYMGCGIQHITPEAKNETLPIYDPGSGICFNADCILDNRSELLSLLQADEAEPDGTLMYLAYRKYGMACLEHFRGLFSLAVYDDRVKTLYLAADPVSSRCLYYYRTEEFICFSTLLEPIRRVCPDIPFNEYYLKDYLVAPGLMPNIVSTETPYAGIYKINPGCYLTITGDTVTEHTYWTPFSHKKSYCFKTAKAYGKDFRELYTECVRDALRTDGEVGISMSSGLDSASVGALAATLMRKEGKTLYSYTYVPYETPEFDRNRNNVHDETADVMKIVEMHPNIKPHFLNNGGKNCLEFISAGLNIMEIPFKAIVNFPNLYEVYCHAGGDGCKIVLTGQTGNGTVSHGYIDDVLFDDYQKGHYLRFLRYLNRHSLKIKQSRKKELQACVSYFRHAKEVYRKQGRLELSPDNSFLAENILEDYPYAERFAGGGIPFLEAVPMNREFYYRFLYNKAMLTYLGELDTKFGLATGVLLRDATRDSRMIRFCAELPYHLFAYRGTPRWLIRGNFTDLLPAGLLENWMRYGVQNSDWLLRIKRDWGTVSADLTAFFSWYQTNDATCDAARLIDSGRVSEYLRSISGKGPDTANYDFNSLTFAKIFLQFIGRENKLLQK